MSMPPPPMPPDFEQARYGQPLKNNGLALAGFIVSIVGICGISLAAIPQVVAIVLSIIGMNQIKANPETQKGRGFAIAGIAISCAMIAIDVIGIILLMALQGNGGNG